MAVIAAAIAIPSAGPAFAQETLDTDETTAAAEEDAESTQTTTSSGSATALEVEGVITVGDTSGDSSGDGEASATALSLGGETVSGGEQSGEGTQEGELGGTGETPLGEISVAPYEATVDGDGNTSSSAALAEVTVVDEDTAKLTVLGSDTETSSDGSHSHSDGARLQAGGDQLDAHVLHAEADSSGESGSAVAVVNDNGVVTDEQAGGQLCPLDAAPLATLDIVCAEASEQSATGEVIDGALGDGALPLTAVQAENQQAADDGGDDTDGGDDGADEETDVGGDEAPQPAPDAGDDLPTTGVSAMGLLAAAVGSIGTGSWLRRRGR